MQLLRFTISACRVAAMEATGCAVGPALWGDGQAPMPMSPRSNVGAEAGRPTHRLAVREAVIPLHPPLPLVGVPIGMERERQQNDSIADGQGREHRAEPAAAAGCLVVLRQE